MASTSTLASINSSFPTGKRDWAVDLNNTSGVDTTMRVYAVCVNRSARKFTVTSAGFTASANAQSSGTVNCPSGVVVGGGVFSNSGSTAVNVNSVFPDTTTSWRADMNNATASDSVFTVWAICRDAAPVGYSRQIGAEVTNPAGSQTNVPVSCPGSSVPLSGGVLSSSGSTAVNVNESVPNGQSWVNYENNASGSDAGATPYAICAGH